MNNNRNVRGTNSFEAKSFNICISNSGGALLGHPWAFPMVFVVVVLLLLLLLVGFER